VSASNFTTGGGTVGETISRSTMAGQWRRPRVGLNELDVGGSDPRTRDADCLLRHVDGEEQLRSAKSA
jgi:hypothetical protein